ncbi:GbsR/MarR family transcriptional regulator [Streptomyces alkaliphilus]|uniref:GbsR/MarR family transcriptional regulator n=1 Tax=Streptomyces alkaliphilus TaxID=1472722 RepID=UPI00188859AD
MQEERMAPRTESGAAGGAVPGETEGPWTPEIAAFVERFAGDLTDAGIQRMASRVFACLLIEDSGALTSAEIAERLRVSSGAISGAVSYLSQVHLVSRERQPGTRRERYRLHQDTWHQAMSNREPVLNRWIASLRHGIEVVGPDTPAGRRLSETLEFMEFMRVEFQEVMRRWDARRAAASAEPAEDTR